MRRKRKLKRTIFVIGDGISEKEYFIQLRRAETLNAKLKPELPKHGNYIYIFNQAEELLKSDRNEHLIDKIYCLIDLDKILDDGKTDEYLKTKSRFSKNDKIIILENFPSFEVWFLFHYFSDIGNVRNDKGIIKKLKSLNQDDFFREYDKSSDFYHSHNVYSHLKSRLNRACKNSEDSIKNISCGIDRIYFPKSEIFRFINMEIKGADK